MQQCRYCYHDIDQTNNRHKGPTTFFRDAPKGQKMEPGGFVCHGEEAMSNKGAENGDAKYPLKGGCLFHADQSRMFNEIKETESERNLNTSN